MVVELVLLAVLLAAGVVTAIREPRRLLPGVLFALLLLGALVLAVAALGRQIVHLSGDDQAGWVLIGFGAACLLAIVTLGVWLMINGLTLVRREGFGISTLLSFGVGLILVGYVVALVVGLLLDRFGDTDESVRLILVLLTLTFPAGYLSLVFLALLLWSTLYGWWGRLQAHRGRVDAIIILGAGLLEGSRISRLLASRLDRGKQVYHWAQAAGRTPMIICSGGKGDDEQLAEAEAMTAYLIEAGIDPSHILIEDRSTDTAENLSYSRRLLDAYDIDGPVAVVTSNYHAFRAATLMRNVGVVGFSVGSPTAFYYVPNAMIREYLAILRDNRWFTAGVLVLLCLPLVLVATGLLGGGMRA